MSGINFPGPPFTLNEPRYGSPIADAAPPSAAPPASDVSDDTPASTVGQDSLTSASRGAKSDIALQDQGLSVQGVGGLGGAEDLFAALGDDEAPTEIRSLDDVQAGIELLKYQGDSLNEGSEFVTPEQAALAANQGEYEMLIENNRYVMGDNGRPALKLGEDGQPILTQIGQEAKNQVEANQPLVQAALRKLDKSDPSVRQRYDAIFDKLEGSPLAQSRLQGMLLDGKLLSGKDALNGANLLDNLHHLTTADMHPAINRNQLMEDVVNEIANPTSINQQTYMTCTAATLQKIIAMENPAEYARIAGGLASPDGRLDLPGGKTLYGSAQQAGMRTTLEGKSNEDLRSNPSRMFQSAMMDAAMQPQGITYNTTADIGIKQTADGIWQQATVHGLTPEQTEAMTRAFSGRDVKTLIAPNPNNTTTPPEVLNSPEFQTKLNGMIDTIQQQLDKGHPVSIGMVWGGKDSTGAVHAGHQVALTRIDKDRVHFENPHGERDSMSLDDFRQRLRSAQIVQY